MRTQTGRSGMGRALVAGGLALSLGAGCSDDPASGTMDMASAQPALNQQVAGTWLSAACEPAGSGAYLKRRYTFTTTTFSVRAEVHEDAQCTAAQLVLEAEGSYTIGATSTVVSGASDAEISFTSRAVTAQTQNGADRLNLFQCGGVTTWTAGARKDVSQAGCVPFADSVTDCPKQYDVVKLDGTSLYLGAAAADSCKQSGRATQLGPALIKQP